MIDSSKTDLQNLFKQQSSIKVDAGCEIEYNMNSLIDGITVTSATPDSAYTNQITSWPSNKANPYKKLFPIDSIIKPFRPLNSGIKYYILNTVDTASGTYSPYRTLQYPNDKPRIYYPGVTTQYKYWLSAEDTHANITVNYKTTGLSGNKNAFTNKIIVRFEKFHALPSSYTLTITKADNTTVVVGPIVTGASGNEVVYYNGSTWSTTKPSSISAPQEIKSINLVAVNPGGGRVIGVIELSARWVKDISSDIIDFSIGKESSSTAEDILPVGWVTANNLSMNIVKYNETLMQTVSYNRASTEFYPNLIYMAKNAELRPYFKVYHSQATDVVGQYDKVNQGVYYINDFNTDAYGLTSITALDGAKYLMETLCPDIVCEFYPVTAILRRLLDSIGFSNYNFNLNAVSETSVPQINYWWTDDAKTVWEAIQELCRDIQMNAFFDENNVLQFYSRDYIYDSSRSGVWTFTEKKDGTTLPNIVSFKQKDIVAANHAVVRWQSALTSDYDNTASELWTAPNTYLSAGGLSNTLTSSAMELSINTKTIDVYSRQQSFYNFSGFVLIDSEIIEYEAIGYDCTLLNGSYEHRWIYSESDVNKYRALCKPGYSNVDNPADSAYFKPSGRYKIKKRGALGTSPAEHTVANVGLGNWTARSVTWDPKARPSFVSTVPTSGNDIVYAAKINQTSLTSVSIDFPTPTITPTSYVVSVQRLNADGTNNGSAVTLPEYTDEPPLDINNLFPGEKYKFKITPKNGTILGNAIETAPYTMATVSYNGSFISNPVTAAELTSGKSYLSLSNAIAKKDNYVIAYKDFDGLTLPNYVLNTAGSNAASKKAKIYEDEYFAFGTTIFLDPYIGSTGASAGIGFFLGGEGKIGYYVLVETTKSSITNETKSVRILKADGTGVVVLRDSQKSSSSTFEGVYGGTQYNIDVRVRVSGQDIHINAYVNGFEITTTDTNKFTNPKDPDPVLDPTQSVALICGNGKVAFDYAYATNLDQKKYDATAATPNLYVGELSNDLLDMSFGDLIYDQNNSESTLKPATIDDFGTVVREIYHVNTKLNARPAFPLKWSTGQNRSVNLLGQKVSNFSAEAYVLNNTSTTVPLSNGGEAILYIYGNTIGQSGTLEYSTDESADYANKEPVIFESKWLQNEYDVKKLAEFIKSKAINRGKVINLDVFGNPLLSVGDIVYIKYTYQGFEGNESAIVTNINQSYNEGIETSIICRTL